MDYLKNILKRGDCILRESDKKLGWSLNSKNWYEKEYKRQLLTDFYSWACGKDEEDQLTKRCRESLRLVIEKRRHFLSENQVRKFNLGVDKGYILPSLNLMPKVHKLADPASLANEGLLTGRPIVTAHSWGTI